jgi:hypothetical protein
MTQETQTGTLKELNVQPGDVVKSVDGAEGVKDYFAKFIGLEWEVRSNDVWCAEIEDSFIIDCEHIFTVVSRATPADTPKTWGEMTDAEKGALLLAELDGECLEQKGRVIVNGESLFRWAPKQEGCWLDSFAYRIKPEPLVETVTAYADPNLGGGFEVNSHCEHWPYRITFTTTNGKPDLDSIKMEQIND